MSRILTMLTLVLMALAMSATPTLAGGGYAGGGGHGECRGFAEGELIELDDNCFDGIGQQVAAGTRLTVRNRGQLPHTYTAVDGSFDTGTLEPGEATSLEVPEPGTWPVRCTLHSDAAGSGMAGLLVVSDEVSMEPAAAGDDGEATGGWIWWVLGAAVTTTAGALLARRLTGART